MVAMKGLNNRIQRRTRRALGLLLALPVLLVTSSVSLADSLPRNLNAIVNDSAPLVVRAQTPIHLREAYAERFSAEGQEKLRNAIAAQERHTEALMSDAGVIGTAVGWAVNDSPVVKVYVQETASSTGIPESVDGVPVVVENVGLVYALGVSCETRGNCDTVSATSSSSEPASAQDWHERPVPLGISIGPSNQYIAGTLACSVSSGCHTFGLTNNHVIANENLNAVGTNILQPGRYDGGINPTDKIGELEDFVPIVFSTSTGTRNKVDAAIFQTTTAEIGVATRSDGYGAPKSQTVSAAIGMDVQKYGRTTGETYGYIDAVNVTVFVEYDTGVARFVNQIIIRNTGGGDFSSSGDSGSLIVADGGTHDRKPVGLLFASGTGITVANPIDEVLTQLGVTIDGE